MSHIVVNIAPPAIMHDVSHIHQAIPDAVSGVGEGIWVGEGIGVGTGFGVGVGFGTGVVSDLFLPLASSTITSPVNGTSEAGLS